MSKSVKTIIDKMSDTIYRQDAIDAVKKHYRAHDNDLLELIAFDIERLPSAQPEIIRCEDCMHNGSFDTDCPIGWNGKEYCSFAERQEE